MLTETAALVTVDKVVAQQALRDYRNARAAVTDEDRAIMTAYRQIARGRIVVQAIESIRVAGRFEDTGLPKLALTRANERKVHCRNWRDSVEFSSLDRWGRGGNRNSMLIKRMPFFDGDGSKNGIAIVPIVPLSLRPKADLGNYHILWEADWTAVPHDPLLLRRLKGDLWIVLAAWDLTAVERAVLAQRP